MSGEGSYHEEMDTPPETKPSMTLWWLAPLLIGMAGMAAALLLGDFRPVVERFYSVF